MDELWLYAWMSRGRALSYRAKIMIMAFIGTHVPLIALVIYIVWHTAADWASFLSTFLVTLGATLAGTALTLFVLNHLLRPVLATSRTLRDYRQTRDTGRLPTHYRDEVGTLMADTAATLDHLERLIERIEHTDESTGLPNRRRLAIDTADRVAAGQAFQLIAWHFGNLRQLAGATELAIAERAAAAVARRLEAELKGEPLYRVDYEDFVALVETGGVEPEQVLEKRLKGQLAGLVAPIPLGDIDLVPQLRAGVTLFPGDGDNAERLIDQALAAAARSTSPIEPAIGFHSAEARATALARLTLEQDLRRAIAADELMLHYQPVVDLAQGRVVCAEALVRWNHPQRGLVMPAAFVPLAEESGLIEAIDQWVLREACAQLRAWRRDGLDAFGVAVNLSALRFLDPALVEQVAEALAATDVPPGALKIELTESAAMADLDHSRKVFGRLRDLGVRIAIDDFGTGYASMRYLHRLPFDTLKIDREFVARVDQEADTQAICDAMIALSRGLGLELVAEGAECAEEIRHLGARGCSLFQGYYFARPQAPAQFRAGLEGFERAALALQAEHAVHH